MPITIKGVEVKPAPTGAVKIVTPEPKTDPVQSNSLSASAIKYDFSVDPMTVPVVHLASAQFLYQRVHGSGASSVYFCIAISGDKNLKLAARYKGKKLSVRAEGFISGFSDILGECGFHVHNDKYASIHLMADTPQLMSRALGALLVSIDIPWETPIPRITRMVELCKKGAA